MMQDGRIFKTGTVDEWMDCGNKNVTVETNTRMLGFLTADREPLVAADVQLENATIVEPCFIGKGVVLKNSTVGPNVSIGAGTHIEGTQIKNSLVQNHSTIRNANLDNAMIGNHVLFDGEFKTISIGDYSVME